MRLDMQLRRLRTSLVAQATLVLALLFTLAVTRVVFVTAYNWMGQHDDEAIAIVSGLRSSVYLLTLRMAGGDTPQSRSEYVVVLERQLDSGELRDAVERPGRQELQHAWRLAREEWARSLRPALQVNDSRAFLAHAGHFVAALDRLDTGLQREHKRLQVLDLKQVIVTMLLVISLQLLIFFTIRTRVARPLHALLDATDKFRAGNLDVRVPYHSDDELGRLTQRFNTMAEALADSHRRLEERVSEQVRDLAQANAALDLLFRSSHSLARGNTGGEALSELLQRFQVLLPRLQLSLRLDSPGDPGDEPAAAHTAIACAPVPCGRSEQHLFPVRSQGQDLGALCVCVEPGGAIGRTESELVSALADLIGSALLLNRQREQDNQLLLLNERSAIARELHDSLAQSLSFMKLQIARLQALIQQGKDCHAVEAVAEELRTGINEAYAQLRGLLSTFRMDVGRAGLAELLEETVQELSRRSGFAIRLQLAPLSRPLDGHERAQVVLVAREALTNAVRHAEASCIELHLREQGDEVELVVDDDGRGVQASVDFLPHHGLAIMQERAHSVGGTLQIESRQPRGTRVRLRFPARRPAPPSEAPSS